MNKREAVAIIRHVAIVEDDVEDRTLSLAVRTVLADPRPQSEMMRDGMREPGDDDDDEEDEGPLIPIGDYLDMVTLGLADFYGSHRMGPTSEETAEQTADRLRRERQKAEHTFLLDVGRLVRRIRDAFAAEVQQLGPIASQRDVARLHFFDLAVLDLRAAFRAHERRVSGW